MQTVTRDRCIMSIERIYEVKCSGCRYVWSDLMDENTDINARCPKCGTYITCVSVPVAIVYDECEV